jgi:hypothetical protein
LGNYLRNDYGWSNWLKSTERRHDYAKRGRHGKQLYAYPTRRGGDRLSIARGFGFGVKYRNQQDSGRNRRRNVLLACLNLGNIRKENANYFRRFDGRSSGTMDNGGATIKPISGAIRMEYYAWSIGKLDWYAMATNYFFALFG